MTSSAHRVVIVVESRHGSTLEIAGALAQRLVFHGLQATVAEPKRSVEIDADVVVIGSAIYLGKWLKPAVRFVDTHADRLAELPVWLFSSGPLTDGRDDEGNVGDGMGDGLDVDALERLTERAHARGHRTFAGRLDRAVLGPIETVMARSVHAPEGDFRDWQEIDDWADEIAAAVTEIGDGITVGTGPSTGPT